MCQKATKYPIGSIMCQKANKCLTGSIMCQKVMEYLTVRGAVAVDAVV